MTTLTAGQEIPELTVIVEASYMKVFSAIMQDPNPIHFDPAHTSALGMGDKPVNQGTLTLSYLVNALLQVVDDAAAIQRVQCRFLGNVVADDVVVAGGKVSDVVDDIAHVDLWLDKQRADGEPRRVLSGTALVSLQ